VPDVTESIETQLYRVLLQLKDKATDLGRFIYLINYFDLNETLSYRTGMWDPARFLRSLRPDHRKACLKLGHILRINHRRVAYVERRRNPVRVMLFSLDTSERLQGRSHPCLTTHHQLDAPGAVVAPMPSPVRSGYYETSSALARRHRFAGLTAGRPEGAKRKFCLVVAVSC